MPDTHAVDTGRTPRPDPVAAERALASDAVLLQELCALLLSRRCNAIEMSNLAFILRHRRPEADAPLAMIEDYGKRLVRSRRPVLEKERDQAIAALEQAAASTGMQQVFQDHCGGT